MSNVILERQPESPILATVKREFPEAEIDSWCSDLYIKFTPEIFEFCKKNFAYPNQVTKFWSENFKAWWIEIPFQYTPYYDRKNIG
jgi:hypothetical protein